MLALSGGLDSVVLLHYLHQYYAGNLRAIHCNHHLSKQAAVWADFCKNLCAGLNIDCLNIDIFIEKPANIEENARKKRYHALSSNLAKDEVLCSAHHQNDQAETLLLQLFRGSGVAGLAAMPSTKPLGQGIHYRPMLGVNKTDIIAYANTHKLNWIEDESNKNTNFRRNFLRLNILPKLTTLYKNLPRTLSRVANHQAEALKLNQALAQIDRQKLLDNNARINVQKLCKLEDYRIKNLLRFQLHSLGFLLPSEQVLTQILMLLRATDDAQPLVRWQTYELRRYQNALYFIDTRTKQTPASCPLYTELSLLPNFAVRYRTEGQRVKLAGKTHARLLKKILQEANIPPWERDTLRMYYIADELRAIERVGRATEV